MLSNTHLTITPIIPTVPARVIIDNMPADEPGKTHKAFLFTDEDGHQEIFERNESGQPYFDLPEPVTKQYQFYWVEYTTTAEQADANFYPAIP